MTGWGPASCSAVPCHQRGPWPALWPVCSPRDVRRAFRSPHSKSAGWAGSSNPLTWHTSNIRGCEPRPVTSAPGHASTPERRGLMGPNRLRGRAQPTPNHPIPAQCRLRGTGGAPGRPGEGRPAVPGHLPAAEMRAEPGTMRHTPVPALGGHSPPPPTPAGAAIPLSSLHFFLPEKKNKTAKKTTPSSPPVRLPSHLQQLPDEDSPVPARLPTTFFPRRSDPQRPFPASPTCPFPAARYRRSAAPGSAAPGSADRSSPAPGSGPPSSGGGDGMEPEQGTLCKAKGKHPGSGRETVFWFFFSSLSVSLFF